MTSKYDICLENSALRKFVQLTKDTPGPSETQRVLAAMAAEILRLRFLVDPMPGDDDLALKAATVFLAHFVSHVGDVQDKARVGFNATLPVMRDRVRAEREAALAKAARCSVLLTDIMHRIKSIRVGGTVDAETERVLHGIFDDCRAATSTA